MAAGTPHQGNISPPVAEPPAVDLADAVNAPMVGTAYLRANPESKPFVDVGSVVKIGDKLLLVEAMKTFNDIVAPGPGNIVSILIVDGAPVEYDQPLMIIESQRSGEAPEALQAKRSARRDVRQDPHRQSR